ncbi:ATPase AAA [Tamlana sedimentorum]|uniref:ATPase AAA n=1 Tax=Neotamlana sedimentorum TaxID=1435349 RepID=A0A0D7WCJ2_9FLAO|nr:AAA family ATPase [Tamlana sedimentorum]KJD36831.1 ATPase AAA [Tamlana sedimentorum]
MNFKRHISIHLEDWKVSSNRKPLVLRGARQVGKTTLIKEFSKGYKHSILLNLEKFKDVRFFEDYEDIHTIKEALFFEHNISSSEINNTLVFIDEIQESPKAIQLLRYFYEELPDLHVIAAGSLLEFAIQQVKSFPVGRIEYLYLYPLNFSEFLLALNKQQAFDELNQIPVKEFAHKTLINLFNTYVIIGGMPEIVQTYIVNNSISDLPKVYESIWTSYKNDVEKYTSNNTERSVIKHIMDVTHLYVDQRIKFQNFGNSNYRSREVSEAFKNLDAAKVIQLIYPTTNLEVPIMPDIKKSPRLQFLDTGLINHDLKIQADLLALNDLSKAYKGAIIPHIITQEILSLNTISTSKPNFWVREKAQASSEVDLAIQYKDKIIPVEIKSGATGALKSLHEFIERTNHNYAIRMYAGAFKIETHETPKQKKPYKLMNLPYYLGTKLPEYIAYFTKHY